MIEQAKFAKEMKVPHSLQIENGDIVNIYPSNTPKIVDKAPSGRMYLDGSISVRADSNSIKERRNLSIHGYLEVTLIIANNGKIRKPVISFKGLPADDLEETFIFDMEDEIDDICKKFLIQNKKQEYNLIEAIKKGCKKIVREKTGKKPYTRINLARI
jgi:ribonuclease J